MISFLRSTCQAIVLHCCWQICFCTLQTGRAALSGRRRWRSVSEMGRGERASERAAGKSAAALPCSLATHGPRTASSGSSSSAQLHGMCEPHRGLTGAILGGKHEACDCSAVVGIRALDCSLAQMGAIHKERWESDFLFLLECCLVPTSKYSLVA